MVNKFYFIIALFLLGCSYSCKISENYNSYIKHKFEKKYQTNISNIKKYNINGVFFIECEMNSYARGDYLVKSNGITNIIGINDTIMKEYYDYTTLFNILLEDSIINESEISTVFPFSSLNCREYYSERKYTDGCNTYIKLNLEMEVIDLGEIKQLLPSGCSSRIYNSIKTYVVTNIKILN